MDKYEKALERCKKEFNFSNLAYSHEEIKERLEHVFPELKESEDESVKAEIIAFIEQSIHRGGGTPIPQEQENRWLAWLGKQGKQKSTYKVEPKFKIGDTIVEKDLDEYDYETIKDIKDGQYIFTDGYSMNIDEQEGWQLVKTPANIEQKLAWSEEDERNLQGIINEIEANKNNAPDYDLATYDRFLSWLKSLKDRVQPKQEWSEEDEKMLKSVISSIRISRSSCEEDDDVRDLFDNEIDWLESLEERMKGETK